MNEFEFVKLESMKVLAVAKSSKEVNACADAWQILIDFVIQKNIIHRVARRLSLKFSDIGSLDELDECSVAIGIEGDDVALEGQVKVQEIEGGHYAVFLHRGSYDTIKNTYIKARDFLKSTDVTLRDGLLFERYIDLESEEGGEEAQKTLLHIPIL